MCRADHIVAKEEDAQGGQVEVANQPPDDNPPTVVHKNSIPANDGEEGNDMIHIRIITSADLKPKLEALDLFQALFKNLEVSDFKNRME